MKTNTEWEQDEVENKNVPIPDTTPDINAINNVSSAATSSWKNKEVFVKK